MLAPELSGYPSEHCKSFVSETFGLRADFENDRLTMIACRKNFIFKNTEMIGSSFKIIDSLFVDFVKTHDPDRVVLSSGAQHIVHVDDLGLSFWLDENDTVRSVDCIAPWL